MPARFDFFSLRGSEWDFSKKARIFKMLDLRDRPDFGDAFCFVTSSSSFTLSLDSSVSDDFNTIRSRLVGGLDSFELPLLPTLTAFFASPGLETGDPCPDEVPPDFFFLSGNGGADVIAAELDWNCRTGQGIWSIDSS